MVGVFVRTETLVTAGAFVTGGNIVTAFFGASSPPGCEDHQSQIPTAHKMSTSHQKELSFPWRLSVLDLRPRDKRGD